MISPPRPPQDELELLIREARERQRRRQALAAATIALSAAVGLSVWAAIPTPGGAGARPTGAPRAGAIRGIEAAARMQVARVGTSGGVTWALNSRGLWLTTNGGRTWREATPPDLRSLGLTDQRVVQVGFLDRTRGWLLATEVPGLPARTHGAEFESTRDGGRTWHRSLPTGCCGAFSFVGRRLGFFFGGDGRLYSTRNGGSSWAPVARKVFGGPLAFLDARHGVAALDGGLIRTADAGRHWTSVLLSGRPPAAGNSIVSGPPFFAFRDTVVLTAERHFGKPSDPGNWHVVPYASNDAGASWSARPLPSWWVPVIGSSDGNRFSAAGASVWFAAARRELLLTTDAGRTWGVVRPTALPSRGVFAAIDFTGPRVGWAIFAGPKRSVLLRTTDGGVHWKPAGPRVPRRDKRG